MDVHQPYSNGFAAEWGMDFDETRDFFTGSGLQILVKLTCTLPQFPFDLVPLLLYTIYIETINPPEWV
jgi:hypothetical protein